MANPDAKYKRDEALAREMYGDALPAGKGREFNNAVRACMARDYVRLGLGPESPVVIDADGTLSILTETPRGYRALVLDVRSDLGGIRQIEMLRVLDWTRKAVRAGTLPAELPHLRDQWRGTPVAPSRATRAAGPGVPQQGLVLAFDATACRRPYDPVAIAAAVPEVDGVGLPGGAGTTWLDPARSGSPAGRVPEVHVHVGLSAAADRFGATSDVVESLAAQGLPLRRIVADLGVPAPGGRAAALNPEEHALIEAVFAAPRQRHVAPPPATTLGGTAVPRGARSGSVPVR